MYEEFTHADYWPNSVGYLRLYKVDKERLRYFQKQAKELFRMTGKRMYATPTGLVNKGYVKKDYVNPRETKPAIASPAGKCICGKSSRMIVLDRSGRKTYTCKNCMPKAMKNPRRVMIYSDVIRIIARKGQFHICDAECKRKDHTYYHDFTPGSKIYGLPDKSLLIKG